MHVLSWRRPRGRPQPIIEFEDAKGVEGRTVHGEMSRADSIRISAGDSPQ